MRTVVQRVTEASVSANGSLLGRIGEGLLVLVGIEHDDLRADAEWLCGKIVNLRIFNDEQGVMNRSLLETGRDLLLVSQFTLHASTKKGNRPSYIRAARPEIAIPLYQFMKEEFQRLMGKMVQTGEFGAMMQVGLINDGPVTIIIDSKNRE